MSFDLDLTTRRALVTGGTKGVGAAVVETLREAGAHHWQWLFQAEAASLRFGSGYEDVRPSWGAAMS
jgi:NAD(P)-dependent dehydrogenase (short-subunit alcohol dehydrogenase family)